MLALLANGVAAVTVLAESELLKPPPLGCNGGSSSVVPLTVTTDVSVSITETSLDERSRRSATWLGDGNVVRSTTRNRKRVIGAPVRVVILRRIDNVPNVEPFSG